MCFNDHDCIRLEDHLKENEVGIHFNNFDNKDSRKHRKMAKNQEFMEWLSSTHSLGFPAMRCVTEGRYYALQFNFDMWLWCISKLKELQLTHKFTWHYRDPNFDRNPNIQYDHASIV